jgi:hypothetical protein
MKSAFQGFNDTENEFCSEKNEEDEDFVMAKCLQSINVHPSDSRDKVYLTFEKLKNQYTGGPSHSRA